MFNIFFRKRTWKTDAIFYGIGFTINVFADIFLLWAMSTGHMHE